MRLFFRGLLPAALLLLTPVVMQAQEADLDPDRGLPLEAARWARFTTTEGTWISLDVSPDGQTIVFDLLGDLYAMPIGGGDATRLTRGMGHDMQFDPVGVVARRGVEGVFIARSGFGQGVKTDEGFVAVACLQGFPEVLGMGPGC